MALQLLWLGLPERIMSSALTLLARGAQYTGNPRVLCIIRIVLYCVLYCVLYYVLFGGSKIKYKVPSTL